MAIERGGRRGILQRCCGWQGLPVGSTTLIYACSSSKAVDDLAGRIGGALQPVFSIHAFPLNIGRPPSPASGQHRVSAEAVLTPRAAAKLLYFVALVARLNPHAFDFKSDEIEAHGRFPS